MEEKNATVGLTPSAWHKAVLFSVLASVFWGVNALFVHILGTEFLASDWLILAMRHGFAGPLLLLVFAFQAHTSQAYMSKKSVFWSCVAGICGLMLSNICNLYVMRTVSVTAAVMLTNTAVVFVLIFGSILARKMPSLLQVFGSVLAFLGAVLVTWQASTEVSCGVFPIFVGFISAATTGAYPFWMAKALEDGSSAVGSTGVALTSVGVASLPFVLASGYSGDTSLALLLFVGVVCAVVTRAIPQLAYSEAVVYAEGDEDRALPAIAVITTLEVVVAAIVSWAFLGEPFGWLKVAGVGLLVLASVLVNKVNEGL